MTPRVLCITENSSLRRLYHQLENKVECEIVNVGSIAQAMVMMVMEPVQAIIFDAALPSFDVCTFLNLLQKNATWKKTAVVVYGYSPLCKVVPKHTLLAKDEKELVRILKDLRGSIKK